MIDFRDLKRSFTQRMFFKSAQVAFLEDYKELLEAGLDERTICKSLMEFGSDSTKSLAADMNLAIRSGKSVTHGMSGWFSPIVLSTLAAGKESGDFTAGLDVSVKTIQDSAGLSGELLGSVKYPAIMLSALVMVYGGPAYDYLLEQQDMVPLYKWSSMSQTAWSISSFCHSYDVAMLLTTIGIIGSIAWALPNVVSRDAMNNVIIFKQYRSLNAIALLSSVANLMRSGVGINNCLTVTKRGAGKWLAGKVDRIQFKIASGKKNYGEIFDVGLLDKDEVSRLKLLSNSEDIPNVLAQSAERQRRKLKKQIAALGKISNLIAMLLAGVGVAVLAGGAYLVIAQSGRVV